jgi:hypothetical protein
MSIIKNEREREIFVCDDEYVLKSLLSMNMKETILYTHWYLNYKENFFVVAVLYFFTFVALFSSIVPIALYVSLELVRAGQARHRKYPTISLLFSFFLLSLTQTFQSCPQNTQRYKIK